MSSLRAEEELPAGALDAAHYCKIHHHLFQDVYRWAGRYRTVRTSKDGNTFCLPENIDREMDRLFARLASERHLQGLTFAPFAGKAARFLADLIAIHPFREGNGRAQLTFLHVLPHRPDIRSC